MAFESIKKIQQAEEDAKKIVDKAAADAQAQIAEATEKYDKKLSFSLGNAEIEAKNIVSRAKLEANEAAKKMRDDTANKCAIMTVRAEKKYDEAIEHIIGKVVV